MIKKSGSFVSFQDPRAVAMDHKGTRYSDNDLGGQLGISEVLLVNGPSRTLIDFRVADEKGACNNVTVFAASEFEGGGGLNADFRVIGSLEFGQGGLSTPAIEFDLGGGQSFSVPGSSVKVSARLVGDPGVATTERLRVGAFITRLPYPRQSIMTPLLAPVIGTNVPVGGTANIDLPPFAAAYRCEFADDNAQVKFVVRELSVDTWVGSGEYAYIRQPTQSMPWIPIAPCARTLRIENQGLSAALVYPMIALEF